MAPFHAQGQEGAPLVSQELLERGNPFLKRFPALFGPLTRKFLDRSAHSNRSDARNITSLPFRAAVIQQQ